MEYTLTNKNGMKAVFVNYACSLKNLFVPDRDGNLIDVVLGYDDEAVYPAGSVSMGAFVGRYANRIGGAAFVLDGKEYRLPVNDGKNHLHGTFNHKAFPGEITSAEAGAADGNREGFVPTGATISSGVYGDSLSSEDSVASGSTGMGLVFSGVSEAGEEGFSGRLEFTVSYELTDENVLAIEYRAVTDAPTVLNFTNHSYFNLNGQTHDTVLNHLLQLDCDYYTEVDDASIPTGRILPVEGTRFDYRTKRQLEGDIDHNFVVRHGAGVDSALKDREPLENSLDYVCTVESPETGIRLVCFTTQPGVQIYTSNHVQKDKAGTGKGNEAYPKYGAICMETQHYPDSPNHADFPSVVLRPGEVFRSRTEYRFSLI